MVSSFRDFLLEYTSQFDVNAQPLNNIGKTNKQKCSQIYT